MRMIMFIIKVLSISRLKIGTRRKRKECMQKRESLLHVHSLGRERAGYARNNHWICIDPKSKDLSTHQPHTQTPISTCTNEVLEYTHARMLASLWQRSGNGAR